MSPRIEYRPWRPGRTALVTIDAANLIIEEYIEQGYRLTLRQLYYQFVARDILPNTTRSYKRLGDIVNRGRLAGLIDWTAIEDRTRNLEALPTWDSPSDIVGIAARQFRTDKWGRQPNRIEVWIEKEALAGVFERVCRELEVPYLSCRGYTSQSEMWGAAQRTNDYIAAGQDVYILHFGDHDPSGIDMTRDIQDRMDLFGEYAGHLAIEVHRLALNMGQVTEYRPPPNPAKTTDSRFNAYIRRFGGESWELDALEPAVLEDLVRTEVVGLRDEALWDEAVAEDEERRAGLALIAERFDEVRAFLRGGAP